MKLEIKNVSKKFGSITALKDVTLTLEEGVYGLLGANGAGKSTLLNLITDNVAREDGEILFDGKDVLSMGEAYRKLIGFIPQQQGFYEHFSARLFLLYIAQLKGIPTKKAKGEIEHLLKLVHLEKDAHKKMGSFSGGMKQRVLLAQALLGNPKILIMDEPTAGLDPKERITFRNFISELSTDKIVLFSTHIVGDIECIADQVILLKNGELLQFETPSNLIRSIEGKVSEMTCTKEELPMLKQLYPAGNVTQQINGLTLRIARDSIPEGFSMIKDSLNLEDVYLYYFEHL